MIWHPPFLNPDRWYVMFLDRESDRPQLAAWRREHLLTVEGPRCTFSASWKLCGRGHGLGMLAGRNGDESDLGLSLYLGPLGSLWLRLRAPWLRWARVRQDSCPDWYLARHTGLRLHSFDGCLIQLQVEDRDGTWSRGQPWWRDWTLTVSDLVGPTDVERTPGRSGSTVVPMPEGNYPADWKEEVLTWRYRRWPGTWIDLARGFRRRRDVQLDIPGGIPIEGKGENSWDCGMDGLFGCGGSTLEDAVANAVRHVLRDRDRYGGRHDLAQPTSVQEAAR